MNLVPVSFQGLTRPWKTLDGARFLTFLKFDDQKQVIKFERGSPKFGGPGATAAFARR